MTVDRLQTASETDTFNVDLSNAMTVLGNQQIVLNTARPGTASIVISPDEKTYSYSISDSLGRTIMSGINYGPDETEGTLNDLINWNVTKYDESDTVANFPVEVVTSIDIDNYKTQSLTDAFGWTLSSKQIETTPSRTNTTLTEFDVSGNPLEVTDANGNVLEYTYDALGRQLTMAVDPGDLNLVTETHYFDASVGPASLVSMTKDANENEINYLPGDYDVLGRLTIVRDRMDDVLAGDNYTIREYDTAGNLDMITDALGNITDYDYDLLGRRTMTTWAEGKQEIVERDGLGRMSSVLWLGSLGLGNEENSNLGLLREYLYAYSGVVQEITFTDNRTSQSDKHLFGYDNFLRRTSSENEIDNVKQTFTYTDRGQLKTEQFDYDTVASNNPVFTTTYSYDDHGRLESIIYPSSANEVGYTYTGRSQLATVDWNDGSANQIEARIYDQGGRLEEIERDHFDEVRGYDAANRLTEIDNQNPSEQDTNNQIGDLSYTWDPNGNKLSETWSNGPGGLADWDFTTVSIGSGDYLEGYDEEDRLRRFIRDSSEPSVDADVYMDREGTADVTIGNIASLTGGANASFDGNRSYSDIYELTSIGSTPLTQTYNLDGQVATTHSGIDLDWDSSGRLKEVDVDQNATAGIEGIFSYGYDCDGRRVWKKQQGESTFTVYCYGGPNVISEITIDTTPSPDDAEVEKEFVYGTTIDELLLVDTGSTQLGVTRNQQWSIMSVYNYVTGAIVGRFNYDVFGKRFILNDDATLATNQADDFGIPYGYTSRQHDPESDLMYFRARYYDPTTGEFISKDPLEYVDGMSMYRGYFVPDSADPKGQAICKCTTTSWGAGSGGGASTSTTTFVQTNGACAGLNKSSSGPFGGFDTNCGNPLTPDEKKVVALCNGNPVCETSITVLINRVSTTRLYCVPFEIPVIGLDKEGYCFPWLRKFKKCYTYTEWTETTTTLPGGCTVELLEVDVKPEKLDPDTGTLPTFNSHLGPSLGARPWGYNSHGIGRVCCGTGDNKKCMYFDVGSQSVTGQFGGDDKWFCPNDENFLDEIDPTSERPFR